MLLEQRLSERRRTFKGGSISLNGQAAIDCLVRNLSTTGACLEIKSPNGIPNTFRLLIKPEILVRRCEVIWKTDHKIGVRFSP